MHTEALKIHLSTSKISTTVIVILIPKYIYLLQIPDEDIIFIAKYESLHQCCEIRWRVFSQLINNDYKINNFKIFINFLNSGHTGGQLN